MVTTAGPTVLATARKLSELFRSNEVSGKGVFASAKAERSSSGPLPSLRMSGNAFRKTSRSDENAQQARRKSTTRDEVDEWICVSLLGSGSHRVPPQHDLKEDSLMYYN